MTEESKAVFKLIELQSQVISLMEELEFTESVIKNTIPHDVLVTPSNSPNLATPWGNLVFEIRRLHENCKNINTPPKEILTARHFGVL